MRRWSVLLAVLASLVGGSFAQPTLPQGPGVNRAVAFTINADQLIAAEVVLANESHWVDFNPVDPSRWARTDSIGLIRFAPPGLPEGVYTFAPFHDGYTADSAAANKLFVQQVVWSPSGQQIAFLIHNPTVEEVASGVWFWQPTRETATDPAYQLLRQCPGACGMTGDSGDLRWRADSVAWSPDGSRVLVGITLLQEGRRALSVRPAARDTAIANTAPNPLRYETGHWAADGSIVVSGTNPEKQVGFGLIASSGSVISFTPVMPPVAAWVQDAVQGPDGRFYMFASAVGRGAALGLIDDTGRQITQPLGAGAPQRIRWNAERTAALVETASGVFVAQINGTVTDVSGLLRDGRPFGWASGVPANGSVLPLPPPLATGLPLTLRVGDILAVASDSQAIYAEPAAGATPVAALARGEELMIISEPVIIGETTWYRVQTVTQTGWIRDTSGLMPAAMGG